MSISVKDYTMKYMRSDNDNLRNISLDIKKGERVGVLGPTGSGKTTLFMSFNGTIPHFMKASVEGEIVVEGLKTLDHSTVELAQHVGVVYADPHLATVALAVEDDVAFGPQCLGWSTEAIRETVHEALKRTRMQGFEKRSTTTLSGGELQAVSIASILAMRTQILALDEPLTMLDPIGKQMIIEMLATLFSEKQITLIVSEAGGDIEYFSQLVDRIVVLYNGEILADGPRHEILMNEKLLEKIGIQPPQVTGLAHMLNGPQPYPVTLDEAIPYYKKLLRKRKIRQVKVTKTKTKKKRTGKPIISVRNLHHTFTGLHLVHALKGIDLDIYPGEMIGLIGQNGSGKTTLSLHLIGIYKPTSVEGREVIPDDTVIIINRMNITELMKRGLFQFYDLITTINYAFQNPDNQLFEDTIELEVSYGPKQLGLPEEEVEERVNDALSLYGIKDRKEDPVIFLTKDLKTYTAAASIVALRPKVLIIDEPTTGLDFNSSRRVMMSLKELQRRGHTIIVITHNMRLIAEYVDRCIVMGNGEIFMDGTPGEIFSHPEVLRKVFVQPPQITQLTQGLTDLGFPPDVRNIEEMFKIIDKNIKK